MADLDENMQEVNDIGDLLSQPQDYGNGIDDVCFTSPCYNLNMAFL